MDVSEDRKRKKDKNRDDDEHRKERKVKKARSRSRSRERDSARKQRENRETTRQRSRSRSPDKSNKDEKQRGAPAKDTEVKREVPERKAKETDMLNTRTGGAYIPPARLRMMQAQITDKSSVAYQRLAWEALKKSIHGHINKINVGNIGIIIKQLLRENIVRGRGLLCRSVIQAQAASPTFTNVYAALVSAVNSRFPNIGELLLKRLVIQFKRGFKRNDKPICISSASFIAHLVNQRVAHEILALELLTLLVETPTDDSVEVAIAFLKECGQKLTEVSSKGVNAIFEMLRNILHEGQLDKRVQYMIEVMFQVWKDGFKDHPALIEELELVPEEEQFTHLLMLDDATDPQDILNVFKFDDKYEENEQKYKTLCKEILGSDAESGEEDGSGESGSEESGEEDEEEEGEQKDVTIIDNTETNLVALRRTIYLTINSSLDFEECAHKLMKMQLKPGQEVELCHMFLDCCAEQRTYEKFYGLLAQRFCNINRIYIGPFEQIFKDSYSTAHRLDTNRLRNVSKFFAHLLFTDSISWEVLECVKLNEEDTTSSSRIYIKILFQELAEYMGLKKLNDRLKDPTLQEAFSGIFPRDNPKNTRFSINFFTSIGLGGLTDELREHLKQMPKNVPPPITEITLDSGSSSDSSSSSSSSGSSSSNDSSSSDSSSSGSDGESSKHKNKDKGKKSKKDRNEKNTASNTPEKEANKSQETEKWGHDGFYDTYGKDARRNESRPDRYQHFARPRDVPRRQDDKDRHRDRDYDQRNGDNNSRKGEYNRQYNEDESRRRRDEREERHRERDAREQKNERDENMSRNRSRYNNRGEDSHRERRQERSEEEPRSSKREKDGREKNKGDRENSHEEDNSRKKKSEKDNRKKNQEDDSSDEEQPRSSKREKDGRDKNKRDKENGREEDDSRKKRSEKDKKKNQENDSNDEEQPRSSKREKDDRDKNKRDKENAHEEDDSRKKRNEKDNKKKNREDVSSDEEDSRSRQRDKESKKKYDKYEKENRNVESKSKKDDKRKKDIIDLSIEDNENRKRDKEKKTDKESSRQEKRADRKKRDDNSAEEDTTGKEVAGRYWDSYKHVKSINQNSVEKETGRAEKSRDRRRSRS